MDLRGLQEGLHSVGLEVQAVISGAAGAFISLNFMNGLRVWERWMTFFGGWALASWGAIPIATLLDLKPGVYIGIALALGLFGMSLCAKVISTVRETDWILFAKTVLSIVRGNGGSK